MGENVSLGLFGSANVKCQHLKGGRRRNTGAISLYAIGNFGTILWRGYRTRTARHRWRSH